MGRRDCEKRHGDADERDHDAIDPLRLERIEHARREVAAEKAPACAKLSTPAHDESEKTENERIPNRFGARQRASSPPPVYTNAPRKPNTDAEAPTVTPAPLKNGRCGRKA